jgi:uncharacterized glyoxalase superfamily protein PhnB
MARDHLPCRADGIGQRFKARVRQYLKVWDDKLAKQRYAAGDVLPAGAQIGDFKRIPKNTKVKVDDVEDFHQALLSNGMKPEGEPQKQPSGNREFVLRDPDGYNLVFFQKK